MRCKKVLRRLDDHVDGLLPAAEAEAIRDHLDACDECRETALALKAASASLAAWSDVEPPADCFAKIMARVDALPAAALERPARRGLVLRLPRIDVARFRRVATGGLAAAAAVLAALLVFRTDPRPPHRAQRTWSPNVSVGTPASWFQGGYYFDNGLLYQRGGRPMLQPVSAGSSFDSTEGWPR